MACMLLLICLDKSSCGHRNANSWLGGGSVRLHVKESAAQPQKGRKSLTKRTERGTRVSADRVCCRQYTYAFGVIVDSNVCNPFSRQSYISFPICGQ